MNSKPISWNHEFSYATGLFVADGYLSIDGRHLDFTSKDKEQVQNFKKALGLKNKISKKSRAREEIKKYYYIGFGYKKLYQKFQEIGMPQQKSKNIGELEIPDNLFRDFLRGYLDGDGSIHIYKHPETKHKQLKIRFYSGSKKFLCWLCSKIDELVAVKGKINPGVRSWWLVYSKRDSLKMIRYIYYATNLLCLKRKSKLALDYFKKYKRFNADRWQNRFTVLNR